MPWITTSAGKNIWQADNAQNPAPKSGMAPPAPNLGVTNTPGQGGLGPNLGSGVLPNGTAQNPSGNPINKNLSPTNNPVGGPNPLPPTTLTPTTPSVGTNPNLSADQQKTADIVTNQQKNGGLTDILTSAQDAIDAKARADLQAKNDLANQQDQFNLQNEKNAASAGSSSVSAEFANGREGVSSVGNATLGAEVSNKMTQQISLAQAQVDQAQQDRDQAYKDLETNQTEAGIARAQAADDKLQKLKDAHQKVIDDANKIAQDYQDKAMTFAQSSAGGALATMDIPTITALYHVDAPTAAALQNFAVQKQAFDQTQPDYQAKVASVNRDIEAAKASGLDGQTKAIDLMQSYMSLGNTNAALKVAKDNGLLGNSNYEQAVSQTQAGLKDQASTYNSTGIYKPVNGVYNVTPNGKGGIKIDTPVGQCPANGRGQCGQFVNDFFDKNTHLFGDSYASKLQMKNSDKPVVGGAFIMKTAGASASYGHTGIVTQVYPDGSFDYTDSNRHDISAPETVDTNHFSGSNYASGGYTGFFDPSKSAPGWTPNKSFTPNPATSSADELMKAFPNLSSKPAEVDPLIIKDLASQYASGTSLNDIKAQVDASNVPKAQQAGYIASVLHQVASQGESVKQEQDNAPVAGTTGNPNVDRTAPGYLTEQVQGAGGFTQAEIDQAATSYALTGQLPNLGRSSNKATQEKRDAIMARASELNSSGNIQANKVNLQANQASLVEQTKYKNDVNRSLTNAENGFQSLLSDFKGKVNNSDITLSNAIQNKAKYGLGDQDIAAFRAGLQEVKNEYSQVFSRGGGVTESTKAAADKLLDENLSFSALEAINKQLQTQGGIVKSGLDKTVSGIQNDMNNILSGASGGSSGGFNPNSFVTGKTSTSAPKDNKSLITGP